VLVFSGALAHDFINDLVYCIIAAWVLGVLAHLFKQPLILAYLVAGYLIGPLGLKWVHSAESIETISEIGLSLLLFMIGLEIDLKKMLGAGRTITLSALSQIVGGCLAGVGFFYLTGYALGQGRLDALYLGIAAALSSTVIIVKLLYEKHELDTLAGRITLGVLVLQDLFAILFLALQPNLQNPAPELLVLSLGKVICLVAIAFTVSRFVLPSIFRAVARLPELVLVGALAWCFMLAGLASWLELSREMGALIAGVALSTSPYTLDVTSKVTSLRDFFVTLFFVALGMKIPQPTPSIILSALVISAFVIASRFFTIGPVLHALKQGHRMTLVPAINLSQMSEFSLVILVLGVQAGHIAQNVLDVSAYAFVILAVASTYAVMRSEQLLDLLSPVLTRLGAHDLEREAEAHGKPTPARIVILGFQRVESALLEEIAMKDEALIKEIAVLDYNPEVNEKLRQRGVRVIYADISRRDTLLHAGADHAEILVCALPDKVLKGITKARLVQQLREINPKAKIVVTCESLSEVDDLYAVGATCVSVPRFSQADEIFQLLHAAIDGSLPGRRAELDALLHARTEVVP
jgi:Kef-type K+ transport system membrane component KefB